MSKKPRAVSAETDGRRKGRPKSSAGVQATLERLTGKSPCPRYLLQTANKYLRTTLFDVFVPRGKKASNEEKLSHPAAGTLLLNALELDDLFLGETSTVIKLLRKDFSAEQLAEKLSAAQRSVSWRHERYAYWHRRGAALNAVMTKPDLDFKSVRVDDLLNQHLPHEPAARGDPFAMRAMQELERIEERGRLVGPNADSLAEQAEAYLNLGGYREAAQKARQATELDDRHAKGWFVRVVAAIRLRDVEAREVHRWRIEATEVAEVMSAHEAMAHDEAAEAADRWNKRQLSVADLAAQALLHWPTVGRGYPAHPEWRATVKKTFLQHCVSAIRLDRHVMDGMSAYVINGFAPEWDLYCQRGYMRRFSGDPADAKLPFSALHREALDLLLSELAQRPEQFFTDFWDGWLAWRLELVHLCWVMRAPCYKELWADFSHTLDEVASAESFERHILGNSYRAMLWQSHLARNRGEAAVVVAMNQWRQRAIAQRAQVNVGRLLSSYVWLYHHQLARSDWDGCQHTSTLGMELLDEDEKLSATTVVHPFDDHIRVPANSKLYWQYLYAMAVVRAVHSGLPLSCEAKSFLAQATSWREAFSDTHACFWIEAEEYEGGGGDEYPVPPYDLDLTDEASWTDPTIHASSKPFEDFDVALFPDASDSAAN